MKHKRVIARTGTLLAFLCVLAACEGPQGEPGAKGRLLWEGPFSFQLQGARPEQSMDLNGFSDALRQAMAALPDDAGDRPENPASLAVSGLNLAEVEQLYALYSALARYVNLDLSGCGGAVLALTDPVFYGENQKNIVSLVLPESVETLEGGGILSGCEHLVSVDMPGVRYLGGQSFQSCSSLREIKAPRLAMAEEKAFDRCGALESVDFPELVYLGTEAFVNCIFLAASTFPKLETIGERAFSGCAGLESLELPAVRSIGNRAFASCRSFSRLRLGPVPPELGGVLFYGAYIDSIVIRVPAASMAAYRQWNT